MTRATAEPFSREVERAAPAPGAAPRRTAPFGAEVPWFLDVREVLHVLRLRKTVVALPVAGMLALGVGAALTVTPQYTASTVLLIDPQGLMVVKDDLTPPGQASDASLILVDSQMQVLSSDDVLRRVVERFGLAADPDFVGRPSLIGRLLSGVAGLLGAGAGRTPDPSLVALRSLRERMGVRRLERSFALTVSLTAGDPQRAADIAQGVADTYLAYDGQVRGDLASRAGAAITARLGQLQADVREAEDRAQAYRTAENLVGTRTQLLSEQQLNQLSEQLGVARARAAEQRTRLGQIEAVLKTGGSPTALPEVLQSATISQLRTQLAQAERVLAFQRTRLGAMHPTLIAAQNDVEAARAQLNAEVGRIVAGVRNDVKSAEANVAQLVDALDKGKTQAVTVGDSMVHLRELERQIDARRSVYETFLVRARELQAQQQLGTSASRVISPATPPARRDGTSALLLIGAAGAAGLGLGVGGALLAERASGRIRTARRLGEALGLEVAGALPPAEAEGAADASGAPRPAAGYDLGVSRLRNHLWQRIPDGDGRVVLVTAADAEAGKAVLAMQLAAVAAADGERVLLVDADPAEDLPGQYGLPIIPAGRTTEARGGWAEHQVLGLSGLHYVQARRPLPREDYRSVTSAILALAGDFDTVVVHAGRLGDDLFTERLAGDPRLSAALLAVSATRSAVDVVERGLARVDRRAGLVAVLTDAEPMDV